MSRGSRGGVVAWAVMAAAVLLLLVIPATAIVVDARGGAAGRGVPLATGGLSTIEGPVGAITLLARSLAWAVAVAAGAAIAGSFAARGLAFAWFGAARGRSIAPAVATVALGSLTLLPPSLLVYSLWSATGPGTALGEWTGLGEDAVRGGSADVAGIDSTPRAAETAANTAGGLAARACLDVGDAMSMPGGSANTT